MKEIRDPAEKVGRGVVGFAKSALAVVHSGGTLASRERLQTRLETCASCPDRCIEVVDKPVCGHCGCDMRIKARFAATTCPRQREW